MRSSPFCSGSWSLADSKARTVARGGLRRSCARACRVGGSAAARGSPAPAARPVTRRRAALPGLRLSFVTHLRYKGPDRLFPFPYRLLHAASASGGWAMTFEEILDQAIAMLQRRRRVTYSTLKLQFQLDDVQLAALKDELLYSQPHAVDDAGRGLVWTGDTASGADPTAAAVLVQAQAPLTYTPPYLAEKILTSRSALEGERKQVTVLFADLKDSTELIRGLDPEEARRL